ncbi:MAG: type 4a pilus biogenesis protein PilO [Actinomycetota bacterium]|nr:type 4a pilus biogenesis protein PilO [Actinomycetota bacterium]
MAFKLSPRDQIIAMGVGALLILVVTVLLVLKPQFAKISNLKAEQETEKTSLGQAKLKLQQLDAIRAEAADIEAKRISLSRRLPDDAELPTLVVELQKVANRAGLDFGSVQVGAVAEQSGYAEIPLSLAVTGTFYSIVDYLYRLEKSTREIVVDSFSLQPATYPQLQISIQARAFKTTNTAVPQLPPPSPAPAAGAPAAGGTQ